MAKRIFTALSLTFTAGAASAALTGNTYMAMTGGSATQVSDVLEVLISGKETASVVAATELARTIFAGTTPAALAAPHSDGPANPATAALAATVTTWVSGNTSPFVSNLTTDAKLNLGLNLFGGIIRWNAAPTQQWTLSGASAPGGVSVLFNSSTAGGASGKLDAHIMYEPY